MSNVRESNFTVEELAAIMLAADPDDYTVGGQLRLAFPKKKANAVPAMPTPQIQFQGKNLLFAATAPIIWTINPFTGTEGEGMRKFGGVAFPVYKYDGYFPVDKDGSAFAGPIPTAKDLNPFFVVVDRVDKLIEATLKRMIDYGNRLTFDIENIKTQKTNMNTSLANLAYIKEILKPQSIMIVKKYEEIITNFLNSQKMGDLIDTIAVYVIKPPTITLSVTRESKTNKELVNPLFHAKLYIKPNAKPGFDADNVIKLMDVQHNSSTGKDKLMSLEPLPVTEYNAHEFITRGKKISGMVAMDYIPFSPNGYKCACLFQKECFLITTTSTPTGSKQDKLDRLMSMLNMKKDEGANEDNTEATEATEATESAEVADDSTVVNADEDFS
jgi:hypothetical protein